MIDARERDGTPGLVKVDLEKASKNIHCSCLDYTLARFGFGNR